MKRKTLMLAALGLFLFAQSALADWTPAKRLTWTSGHSQGASIALDSSGNLHLVWTDDTSGGGEIYYRKSTDGGTSWMVPRRLSWSSGYSGIPALAVEPSGIIHVAWQDDTIGNYEVYYRKSVDGGDTWTAGKRLTWNSGNSYMPALAVDSAGNVHILWSDETSGNCEIYYRKGMNGGATWSPSQRLTWTANWSGSLAVIADSSDNLHAVWYDYTPGNAEIYYRKSTDGGSTWAAAKRLTWNAGASYEPAISVDSTGNLHVVWADYQPGNWEIYHKKSTDGGDTWAASHRLTWNSEDSYIPALAVDSQDNLHVVYQDNTPGEYEIYYKKSTDGGGYWTGSKRLTWTIGYSLGPGIAIDSSDVIHIVWEDNTPGKFAIYYMNGN